jgi:hypothetical protein
MQRLSFEAYVIEAGGERQLLERGARDYDPQGDISVVERRSDDGAVSWSKSLKLFGRFSLSVHIVRDLVLDGFGLSIKNSDYPNGFSWEWFQQESGDVFRKLQGSGGVRIGIVKTSEYEELRRVEFASDVTLRYLDDMMRTHLPGESTHEILIQQGSVLELAS